MDGFKQGVCQFLHNGRRLRTDALLPLIEKLQELKAVLSTLDTFRFYTSSLLLAYEGLDPEYSGDDEPSMITDDDSSNDSTTMHSTTTAGGIRIIHGFKEINSPSSILGMMSSAKSADSIITRGQSLDESALSSSSSSSSSNSSPPGSSQQSTSTCHRHPPHQDDDDCAMDTTDVNAASTTSAGVTTTMTASTSGNDVNVAPPSATAATSSSTSTTAGCRMVGSISSDAVSKMTAASITGTPLIQQSTSSSSSTLRSGGSTGTSSSTSAASLNSEAVDVRMIDFAHSCHAGMGYYSKEHTGPDTGYIFGLQNLIKVLQEICDEHCGGYDMDENSGDGEL